MEIFLSSVLGELATRSVSFIINKFYKPSVLDVEHRLRMVLIRAQVIIDEAIGRRITNPAMIQQLGMLRHAVHRGYYKLDTFSFQYHNTSDEAEDQTVSHYYSLFPNGTSAKIFEEMQEVHDSLSSMLLDAKELVIFLKSYPRLYRQPYSMHLLLANCMFDRQMERELVVNFLLCTKTHHAKELEVLPIVGPGRVGKSTLIAHVCNDERIRDRFSEIMFLSDHDFRDEIMLSVFRQRCAMDLQEHTSRKAGRLLLVVELAGEVTEAAWKKLCFAFKQSATNGSKIIITSRSGMITKLGTTRAITLTYPSNEAFWYFFRMLAFGSTDPEQHPRLASVAMEIARMLNNGPLFGANITASLLRDNFDINFWRKVLAFIKGFIQKHITKFGEHPCHLLNQSRPTHLRRMGGAYEDVVVYDQYEFASQKAVPNITFHDVIYGSVKPPGKFEILLWSSQIPPYYNYVYTCQIQNVKPRAAKRKRALIMG